MAALHDFERYEREIQELSLSIAAYQTELAERRDPTLKTEIDRFEDDRAMARKSGQRAYQKIMDSQGPCQMCEGNGYRVSLGQVTGRSTRGEGAEG